MSCELMMAVSDPGGSVAQQGWKASQLTEHRQTNIFGYLNSQHEWDCTCKSCLYLIADVTDFFGTNTGVAGTTLFYPPVSEAQLTNLPSCL